MGNGIRLRTASRFRPAPPTVTSVPSTPESIERWVRQIRADDGAQGRSVDSYILDNEPMLWNSTHRDVHPEPDDLRRAAREDDRLRHGDSAGGSGGEDRRTGGMGLAGLSLLGQGRGGRRLPPARSPGARRRAADSVVPAQGCASTSRRSGTKILDILDVHFYPMGEGIGITTGGKTDPATSARRIRSTRSLWDPTYKDESWIDERMRVIPLLREWIAANYPGLGISIGEWNFGAETHMSGGLAAAEVLGRFGSEGVTSAYYWTSPGRPLAGVLGVPRVPQLRRQGRTLPGLDRAGQGQCHADVALRVSRRAIGSVSWRCCSTCPR